MGIASSKPIAFHAAVTQVVEALAYYQTHLRADNGSLLPALSQVDFDFKIVTATSLGVSASGLYLLSLGATGEKNILNQITYSYKSLPAPEGGPASAAKPALLAELIDTLQTVAIAAKEAHTFGNTRYQTMKVQVQFGFRGSVQGGFSVPGEVVTVGISSRYDRSTIQTVTLTFTAG